MQIEDCRNTGYQHATLVTINATDRDEILKELSRCYLLPMPVRVEGAAFPSSMRFLSIREIQSYRDGLIDAERVFKGGR